MFIKKITHQNRRDFIAVYECGTCGMTVEGKGYDDEYFHVNAVPAMVCNNCQATAGKEYAPRTPKHPEGFQV